jgi:NitT/TauT family transport system substrate-binding protein
MDNVHIRFLRYSAFYTPLLLTLTGDRLRTEGLTATYDKVTPERTIDAGLREGSVQVAQSAPAVNFLPALKGEPPPYRHFALLNARDGFFLAARDRAIPFTWRSLEGRTVLVDHFFQPHALFRAALRLQGVEEAQVRIVDAGDVASIEAAFRAGVGDFVHMQGPAPQQLEREGLGRVVASVGAAVGPLAFSSLCARPEWLQTEVARAFGSPPRSPPPESSPGSWLPSSPTYRQRRSPPPSPPTRSSRPGSATYRSPRTCTIARSGSS